MSHSASLPHVIFAGSPEHLDLAFPAVLRTALDGRVKWLPEICVADWNQVPASTLAEADYILGTWGMPKLDEAFLAAAPKLRGVFYAAGTVKGFVTDASYARGVTISSAWSANGVPVAEYTLSTILLSLKKFWAYTHQTRSEKSWKRPIPIPGAYGSTVGIVSLGAIGRYLVDLLQHFDLRVIAYDPFLTPEDAARMGVESVSLEAIFDQADVVSIHAPWLPETEGMVHAGLLSRMKPGATLINTSRGAVINELDLCRVFSERTDLTAILDVTYPEPPADDSPLFDCPNILMTPHIAGSVGGEISRMGKWMCDELLRAIDGQPLKHEISAEMLPKMA